MAENPRTHALSQTTGKQFYGKQGMNIGDGLAHSLFLTSLVSDLLEYILLKNVRQVAMPSLIFSIDLRPTIRDKTPTALFLAFDRKEAQEQIGGEECPCCLRGLRRFVSKLLIVCQFDVSETAWEHFRRETAYRISEELLSLQDSPHTRSIPGIRTSKSLGYRPILALLHQRSDFQREPLTYGKGVCHICIPSLIFFVHRPQVDSCRFTSTTKDRL